MNNMEQEIIRRAIEAGQLAAWEDLILGEASTILPHEDDAPNDLYAEVFTMAYNAAIERAGK